MKPNFYFSTFSFGFVSKLNLILIFIILMLPLTGFSQNGLANTTSEWSITAHRDLKSGVVVNQGSIVILTDDEIAWGPTKDDLTSMSILSEKGKWDSIVNRGKVIFQIDIGDGVGTATISGGSKGIEILIDLTYDNGSSRLLLTCDQVTYK